MLHGPWRRVYASRMTRERGKPASLARERALRRRLQAVLLPLGLLPGVAVAIAAVVERSLAGGASAPRPLAVPLAVLVLVTAAGALASLALSRRLSRRLADLEQRVGRFRTAFDGACLAASLADGAWLARLQELQRSVDEHTAAFRAENVELESFAYAVSHDLRAPVRHVNAFAAMLGQRSAGTLDEQSRHYLEVVTQAAGRMAALVDDLLAFVQMRHTEILRSPIDAGALVHQLIADLAPQIVGRQVEWKVGKLPAVDANPRLLRVVLANLLSNAVKFSFTRPSAVIEIGGGPTPGGEGSVLFVRDNGIGFDARQAGKLFQVFRRLQRFEDYEGTGMGLAMVRRIVERHGGRAWAESAPGEGATFFVSFPNEVVPPRVHGTRRG